MMVVAVLQGLEIFQDDPLRFEPGTQYSYSSDGWNLVRAIIEGATGKPYPEQGLVIAMITNLSNGPDFHSDDIVELFLN